MSHQIMSQKPNGRPKILFVEDDPSVVLTFQTGLEAEGYSVDAVNSTSDALTRLANENYPIVITDIYLDERTGARRPAGFARLQSRLGRHHDHRSRHDGNRDGGDRARSFRLHRSCLYGCFSKPQDVG